MIDQTTITAILKQIVMDMAYQEGKQVNTFFKIDAPPNIKSDSLGATYQDFEDGVFYSRTWYLGGSKPDEMCAEWPAAFFEEIDTTQEQKSGDFISAKYALILVDRIVCENCETKQRTRNQVKDNIMDMIRGIVHELLTYEKWLINDGTTNKEIWISRGRKEQLEADPESTIIFINWLSDMLTIVGDGSMEIKEWGNHMDMCGYIVFLQFNYCLPTNIVFNYDSTAVELEAVERCDSC